MGENPWYAGHLRAIAQLLVNLLVIANDLPLSRPTFPRSQ